MLVKVNDHQHVNPDHIVLVDEQPDGSIAIHLTGGLVIHAANRDWLSGEKPKATQEVKKGK